MVILLWSSRASTVVMTCLSHAAMFAVLKGRACMVSALEYTLRTLCAIWKAPVLYAATVMSHAVGRLASAPAS